MKTGLKLAAQKGYHVKGIGIDTWGVDFGLIDKKGNLLGNPVCYRDARTDGMPDKVFQILDAQKHYACTGIQVMPINTLFQLYSMQQNQGHGPSRRSPCPTRAANESGRTARSCTAASLYARPLQLLPDGSSQ